MPEIDMDEPIPKGGKPKSPNRFWDIIGKALTNSNTRRILLDQMGAPDLPTLAYWAEQAENNGWSVDEMERRMKESLSKPPPDEEPPLEPPQE
jgi:hypothetical protein